MLDLIKERFNFSYETDAASSYLVISLGHGEKIIDYQVEMIANNPTNFILPLSVRQKDDRINLYYDITSKQSLSQFLKRKKLKRNEFIELLKNITRTFLGCKNYFLIDKNFFLAEEYVYVNPVTLETSLAYLPVPIDVDFLKVFRNFITNLIINSSHIDEDYSDNFLQRILNHLKADTFNVGSLDKLLIELRTGAIPEADKGSGFHQEHIQTMKKASEDLKIRIPQQVNQKPCKQEAVKAPVRIESFQQAVRNNRIIGEIFPEGPTKMRYKSNIILIAALSQILIVIAMIILYQTVLVKEKTDSSSIFGLILIAGAIDFVILKNLFDKKNMEAVEVTAIEKDNKLSLDFEDNSSMPEKVRMFNAEAHNRLTKQDKLQNVKDSISDSFSETASTLQVTEVISAGMGEDTAILGDSQEKHPYLQSVKDGVVEKISITKPSFVIGRLKDQVDFISKNNAVGKVHAEIISRDGLFYIKDLNSRNGTYINGERINSNIEYRIKDQDKITLANSEYIFYEGV